MNIHVAILLLGLYRKELPENILEIYFVIMNLSTENLHWMKTIEEKVSIHFFPKGPKS